MQTLLKLRVAHKKPRYKVSIYITQFVLEAIWLMCTILIHMIRRSETTNKNATTHRYSVKIGCNENAQAGENAVHYN